MTERRNILFLSHRVPFPPDKGDRIRTFHQLAQLTMSHNVFCASFADDRSALAQARSLRRWCSDVIAIPWGRWVGAYRAGKGWLEGRPLSIGAYRDERMFGALAARVAETRFDVVTAFSACMAPYALAVPAKRRVLDLCDVDSEKWLEYAASGGRWSSVYRREGERLREFELSCLHRFDAVLLATERERALLDPRQTCRSLYVSRNGVQRGARPGSNPTKRGYTIGFVGAMNYRPNVEGIRWFAREAWPKVRAEIPQAKLMIIGRDPSSEVHELRRYAGIEVTGEVRDVRRQVDQCRVMVAPLRMSRGVPNKVLEAMAAGRPVVATKAVAASLTESASEAAMVADDAKGFAGHVVELCRSNELCEAKGRAGFEAVGRDYDWGDILSEYERWIVGEAMEPDRGVTWRQFLRVRRQGVERGVRSSREEAETAALAARAEFAAREG